MLPLPDDAKLWSWSDSKTVMMSLFGSWSLTGEGLVVFWKGQSYYQGPLS